jgi:hypothetical protein
MTVITMSRNKLTRLRVLIDIADGGLSIGCHGTYWRRTKTDLPADASLP